MKIPTPFWFYFIPMLAGTFGLIPQSHPVYTFISKQLLPACLVLLLIGTDLKALAGMGKKAFLLMSAGAAGTVAGGLIAFRIFRSWLPAETWGGIGALAGSWTGGSANMLAVQQALNLPDGLIGPLIIVDAGIAYSWMALLIWSASQQQKWEAWISRRGPAGQARHRRPSGHGVPRDSAGRARPTLSEEPRWDSERPCGPAGPAGGKPSLLLVAIATAIALSLGAQWLAQRMPAAGGAINASTWTVLLVTLAALLLSLTPMRRLEQAGASRIGTLALYLLLATIGARADFRSILQTPAFLALGVTWILIHGACLLLAGWALRAPLGLVAAASQANIGGPISTPIVGATFSSELAGLGLLMAIFGNVVGTYLGLATAAVAFRLRY